LLRAAQTLLAEMGSLRDLDLGPSESDSDTSAAAAPGGAV
jgi:hypothetical protein